MTRMSRAAWSLAVVLLWCTTAQAQIGGRPIEVSGGAGWSEPDSRSFTKSGPAWTGAIGWRWHSGLTLEGQGTWLPSESDRGLGDQNFVMYGLDARLNMRPAEGKLVPFLLGGLGYAASNNEAASPAKLERGAPTLGMGLLWNVMHQRLYLRFQGRDILFQDRDSKETSHYLMATAGLQWAFGGKEKDQDLDKVRDWLDQCPNTPIGALVDEHGCPLDSDADSVFDGIDQCANTPRGCLINAVGCPADADSDAVCDGLDRCADTPRGARVDSTGCPLDSDGDGVFDGLDACDNTARGCTVDARGCPSDADGDGVCDGVDVCPNTPAGLQVTATGCPIEISEKEVQLLDTGTIRLQNVEFDTGKASLKAGAAVVLNEVAQILQQYPTLRIEVGGHTDDRGSAAANQKLSQARADSVLAYVRPRVPALAADQLTAKGYGESTPAGPNTTDAGRKLNRRVEFKVLNTEALPIEREKRRFLRQGEVSAPADTTQKR